MLCSSVQQKSMRFTAVLKKCYKSEIHDANLKLNIDHIT